MTGKRVGRTPPLEISFRDPKPVAVAVFVPSLIYAGVTLFVLAAFARAFDEGWWGRLEQLVTALGRGVNGQLGWVFGILVTVQLGCLIALIGGQIRAKSRRVEALLRDALSLFSVMPVVALSPALTVAIIAAFLIGELRGSLLVTVPMLALTVALSIFIGALERADDRTKLDFAREDEERVVAQLIILEGVQDSPFGKTVLRVSVALTLLALAGGALLSAVSGGFPWPVWAYVMICILIGCNILMAVSGMGVVNAALKPSLGLVDVAFAALGLIAAGALFVASSLILFILSWQFGAVFLLVGVLLVLGWVRVFLEAREVRARRKPAGFWRSGGELALAGTRMARKASEKELNGVRGRIESLEAIISQEPRADGRRRGPGGYTVNW